MMIAPVHIALRNDRKPACLQYNFWVAWYYYAALKDRRVPHDV